MGRQRATARSDAVCEDAECYQFTRLPRGDEELLHARFKPWYGDQCIFMHVPPWLVAHGLR